jgi:hypothetical protein
MVEIKNKTMDSEGDSDKKSSGDSLPNGSDFSEPPRVRHIGLQTDTINQRLLEYNVRSIWLGILVILIITFVL